MSVPLSGRWLSISYGTVAGPAETDHTSVAVVSPVARRALGLARLHPSRTALGSDTGGLSTVPVLLMVLAQAAELVLLRGRGGDVAQLVEHRTGTPPTQVRFPGAAILFFPPPPRVDFLCRLFYSVRTPLVCNRRHLRLCAR